MNKNNISILGIGKLGICFSLSLEKAGFNVLGVDVNQDYVDSVNKKTLKSFEPGVEHYLSESKNFKATTNLEEAVTFSDTLFVLVATPSLPDGRYDHSQIESLCSQLKKLGVQSSRKHLVIGCTTMPEYCDQLADNMDSYGYDISYNPEFIAQGTILRDQAFPDMVLIGEATESRGKELEDIYKRLCSNKPRYCRMTRTSAEICKIALNCFVTTKIAYTNMVGDILKSVGEDPQTVLNAISSDSRVGEKCTHYGFGFGGPCFPRDNRALGIYAKDKNCASDISDATDICNKKHLEFMINSFVGDSIIIQGVTYKPNSMILEESQQLAYAVGLAKRGVKVTIIDTPFVIKQVEKIYGDLFIYA
jgi:nucleotide sugar dehydrogenase